MAGHDNPGSTSCDLSEERIVSLLGPTLGPTPTLRVEPEVDSTNDHLARLRASGDAVDILIANAQSAGRGRRGRHWISPAGAGLYLSFFWPSDVPIRQRISLGLVAGLATAEAIEQSCGIGVGLKWPNDLQIHGRKLAGCLVEAGGTGNGPAAVIGIGINVDFANHAGPDQPWTDLVSVIGQRPDRNQLAAILINRLRANLDEFGQSGFAVMRQRWIQRDVLQGRCITAAGQGQATIHGRAAGLDESGHLLLDQDGRIHRLHAGEVTLQRPS